jgi:hypothetical protein
LFKIRGGFNDCAVGRRNVNSGFLIPAATAATTDANQDKKNQTCDTATNDPVNLI